MGNRFLFTVFLISIMFWGSTSQIAAYTLSVDDGRDESFPLIHAVSEDGSKTALLDADPLSSGWILQIDDSSISPADNGWLRTQQSDGDISVLVFSNRDYSFEQRSTVSDTGKFILISARFTNNSTESVNITPLLLLDTYLGEVTGLPFHLPDGSYVSGESLYTGSRIPEWLKSEKNIESPSLALIFDDGIATTPDSIALANWLHLKQQGAAFIPEEGRSFNYLPFSEGDSAVLLSYREQKLRPGDLLEINLIIGLDTGHPDSDTFVKSSPVESDSGIESQKLREYTLRRRIEEIRSVLDSLDYLLDNSETITSEAVLELENLTATQEKLRAEYENL